MIRILFISAALLAAPAAFAQDHTHHSHEADKGHEGHDHTAHDHASHDHKTHEGEGEDHAARADDKGKHRDHDKGAIVLSRTAEIDAALAAGGEPVVVEVLGAVCDFCAKAMNKTFGRRDEVAAVFVDLDAKTLNLVFVTNGAMDDEEINRVVKRSGYKAKAIHRGDHILGAIDASDPS